MALARRDSDFHGPEGVHPDHKDGANGATADVFFADSDHYLDLDFARSMDDIKAISVQLNGQPEIDLNGGNKGFYSDHSMNHSVSSSEAAVVPDAAAAPVLPPAPAAAVAALMAPGPDHDYGVDGVVPTLV
uniref:Uncharacterized protein n=1 Tax=Aegilops tauschii TaxID=37682 RepID=M8AXB2_AEGTA